MAEPEISPLAQKLVEIHDVDVAALYDQNPDGKITARSVLEFLSLTAEEAAVLERQSSKKVQRGEESARDSLALQDRTMNIEKEEAEKNFLALGEQAEPEEPSDVSDFYAETAPNEAPPANDPSPVQEQTEKGSAEPQQQALAQARSQLQATAMVHQKAVMQVGSLRQKNHALGSEVERLKLKEESSRAFIKEMEEKQKRLERELQQAKRKAKPFAWLKKKIF